MKNFCEALLFIFHNNIFEYSNKKKLWSEQYYVLIIL